MQIAKMKRHLRENRPTKKIFNEIKNRAHNIIEGLEVPDMQ